MLHGNDNNNKMANAYHSFTLYPALFEIPNLHFLNLTITTILWVGITIPVVQRKLKYENLK